MTDKERITAATERYFAAAHAIQSGIAAEPDHKKLTPKHLRVGIDLSKSDMCGLTGLLISKGVITEVEYVEAMADAAEAEKENLEKEFTEKNGGIKITLA